MTPFILLYALAYAGLFVAFIPFFSLLLPAKVEAVAGGDRIALLGRITIFGAIVASLSNILFGALSDKSRETRGSRRHWVIAGLGGLILAYGAVHLASSGSALLAGVLAFQIALNMMFAPLIAILADEVPDERKGVAAGLLGIAQPLSSLAGVAVTSMPTEASRFVVACSIAAAMMLPFLLLARETGAGGAEDSLDRAAPFARRDLVLAWAGRLFVQVAGTGVVTYLYFYLVGQLRGSAGGAASEAQAIAWIMAASSLVAVPLTLLCGRISDLRGRRKPLLGIAGGGMTIGLVAMAFAPSWREAAAGYCVFVTGYSIFIALHAAFTMQLLPSPAHRGRDLGLFNLTNTLPNAAGPLLALLLIDESSAFVTLWLTAALLCTVGTGLVLLVRGQR